MKIKITCYKTKLKKLVELKSFQGNLKILSKNK